MPTPGEKNIIRAGDLVLIHLDAQREFLINLTPGVKLSTDHGNIDLTKIISQPFGCIGKTHLGRYFYCLKPSTADIIFKLKRTTTIVYPKDLGPLILETALGPGCRVIDIGTGSGALTLTLAKFVAPDGMVFSYERRAEFIDNARKNVERAGCLNNVTFRHCDIGDNDFQDTEVDALFIDVPEPWSIIPAARRALKSGHTVVSWSPNIEQVKRTVQALKDNGFIRITVREMLERELLIRERGVRPRERGITHTAYLVRAQLTTRLEH